MILPLVGLTVLAVVMLAFIIEPVLRAREDSVLLDAAALPRPAEELPEEPDFGDADPHEVAPDHERRPAPGIPAAIEARPAGDAT